MKVRHIRKRAQARTKRRNAYLWFCVEVESLSAASMALMKMAEGCAAISDALRRIDWARPKIEPGTPQPFVPKVQRWAGTPRSAD